MTSGLVQLAPYTVRAVTIRPTGAKLRSLRRAAAKAPVHAQITARTYSGRTPVTVSVKVLR